MASRMEIDEYINARMEYEKEKEIRRKYEQTIAYPELRPGETMIAGIPFDRQDAQILKELLWKIKRKIPGDPTVYPKELNDAVEEAVKELRR